MVQMLGLIRRKFEWVPTCACSRCCWLSIYIELRQSINFHILICKGNINVVPFISLPRISDVGKIFVGEEHDISIRSTKIFIAYL